MCHAGHVTGLPGLRRDALPRPESTVTVRSALTDRAAAATACHRRRRARAQSIARRQLRERISGIDFEFFFLLFRSKRATDAGTVPVLMLRATESA
jgi:hypothetical protein